MLISSRRWLELFGRQPALVVLVVVFRPHPVLHALGAEPLLIFLADEGIFHPIGDGGAAGRNVAAGIVGVLFARRARLAAGIERTEPGGKPQRILGSGEM